MVEITWVEEQVKQVPHVQAGGATAGRAAESTNRVNGFDRDILSTKALDSINQLKGKKDNYRTRIERSADGHTIGFSIRKDVRRNYTGTKVTSESYSITGFDESVRDENGSAREIYSNRGLKSMKEVRSELKRLMGV